MVELRDITKSFQIGNETTEILRGISLNINAGEYLGILGTSGSGKSTLMYIIGLLDTPTSGQVLFDGQDVSQLSDQTISKLRNQMIGFVFQQFNLINKLTVMENIMLPTIYSRIKLPYKPLDKTMELMERFGIAHRKNYHPNKISGGEQQRTAIARALIMNPKIILADEPTGNLDSKTGKEILDLIGELNQDLKVTIIVVTHDPLVAKRTHHQIHIHDGKIKDGLKN